MKSFLLNNKADFLNALKEGNINENDLSIFIPQPSQNIYPIFLINEERCELLENILKNFFSNKQQVDHFHVKSEAELVMDLGKDYLKKGVSFKLTSFLADKRLSVTDDKSSPKKVPAFSPLDCKDREIFTDAKCLVGEPGISYYQIINFLSTTEMGQNLELLPAFYTKRKSIPSIITLSIRNEVVASLSSIFSQTFSQVVWNIISDFIPQAYSFNNSIKTSLVDTIAIYEGTQFKVRNRPVLRVTFKDEVFSSTKEPQILASVSSTEEESPMSAGMVGVANTLNAKLSIVKDGSFFGASLTEDEKGSSLIKNLEVSDIVRLDHIEFKHGGRVSAEEIVSVFSHSQIFRPEKEDEKTFVGALHRLFNSSMKANETLDTPDSRVFLTRKMRRKAKFSPAPVISASSISLSGTSQIENAASEQKVRNQELIEKFDNQLTEQVFTIRFKKAGMIDKHDITLLAKELEYQAPPVVKFSGWKELSGQLQKHLFITLLDLLKKLKCPPLLDLEWPKDPKVAESFADTLISTYNAGRTDIFDKVKFMFIDNQPSKYTDFKNKLLKQAKNSSAGIGGWSLVSVTKRASVNESRRVLPSPPISLATASGASSTPNKPKAFNPT